MISDLVERAWRKRFFYGWVIVAVVFISNFAGSGMGGWVLTVLIKPMQHDLGWSRAAILGAASTATLIGAAIAPLLGRLVDRYGARAIMAFGAIMQGLLLLILSRVSSIWQLYLLYGLGGALANAELQGVAPLTAIANWFIKQRGRAIAISMMGLSLSGVVFVSLTQKIVDLSSWRTAWTVIGIINLVFVVLPVWFFMRRRPEDMGLQPDGEAKVEPTSNLIAEPVSSGLPNDKEEPSWTATEAVKSKAFWLLAISISFDSIAMMGVWMHMPTYYSDIGFSATIAASAMSLNACGSFIARISWGLLVERMHVRYCICAACIAASLGVAAVMSFSLGLLPPLWVLFLVSFYHGLIVGGLVVLHGVVWPDYFGRRNTGVIRGMAMPIQSIAGSGGPLFAAFIYDKFGSYRAALTIFVGCYLIAAAIVLMAKPSVRGGQKRPTAVASQ